jgi:hypothetical protein
MISIGLVSLIFGVECLSSLVPLDYDTAMDIFWDNSKEGRNTVNHMPDFGTSFA